MKRRRWMVCAAAMCVVLACAGCSDKKNELETSVIEGDDVKEYSSGSENSSAGEGDFSELGKGDSVGGLAKTLAIPDSANIDIPVENCGTVESACIKADSINVPDADKMYVKKFRMGKIGADDRESILKSIFDEDDGIFEYPYDLKEKVIQEQRDEIFAHKGAQVDYSKDYFIGKIDGTEYILYFNDQSWISDEGFNMSRAADSDIPEEMAQLGACMTYHTTFTQEDMDYMKEDDTMKAGIDEKNKCNLSADEAVAKAMDYMAKWGFKDVVVTNEAEMYTEYDDIEGAAVGYEKDGYMVTFEAAVGGQAIYQPDAFGIDTISHQSKSQENFSGDDYYYLEQSEYTISFNSDGIMAFSCTWPMKSDDDLTDAGSLISWNEAVDKLKECMSEHFKDYSGYSSVEFNDVRLAYFRVKTGDGEYEAIPVYAFAQLDDRADDTYPIQLVMLDARDGSEVNIVQDQDRFVNK